MVAPTVVITDDEDNTVGVIEIMSPGMVSFHMTATTLGAGKWIDCLPVWTFGDPSGRYNSLRGFSNAHFWDIEPESSTDFTVRCTVTNVDGETSFIDRTVRLLPNTRRVVFIDPDTGSSTPTDPTDSGDPYDTIASAVAGESNASNMEYRFTESKTHTWGATVGGAGKSNIICRSTTKGVKFNVIASAGTCLNFTNQGLLRDAHFLVSSKGSQTRMADPRSSGTAIRNCILDCTSVDPDVSITLGSLWTEGVAGSKSVLVIDTTADSVYPTVYFAGPMMTFLGVSSSHNGTERAWRGNGDHVTLAYCSGNYYSDDGKTGITRDGGDFFWMYECDMTAENAAAPGSVVSIGHSSGVFTASPKYSVVERTICRTTTALYGMIAAATAQGVIDCVFRNNIVIGAGVNIGSLVSEHPVTGVFLLHNTIIAPEKDTKIRIAGFYDEVTVRNNLSIGYPESPSLDPETMNIQNTGTSSPIVSDNVWPTADLNKDVRVDGAGTRITWSTYNALGIGSGNLVKEITVGESYRPDNTADSDLLFAPPAEMDQFREDYYGNPRYGDLWLVGAVDVASRKRSFGLGINLGV